MTQQYFSQKFINPLEKPLKELMELNMKAFQNFSYINPVDLFNVAKPEEILGKNLEIFIQNSHRTLDYMQNMISIMEKNWLNLSDKLISNTQEMMKQVPIMTEQNLKKATDVGQRTAKKVASTVKKATKKTVKKAETIARKNSEQAVKTMKQATKTATSILKNTTKPSATKKNKAKVSKVAVGGNSVKAEIKGVSSAMVEKPNTVNRIEAKIHETRQVNPLSAPTISKNLDIKDKKDKPLM